MAYRKSAAHLTAAERDAFINAVQSLKTTLVDKRDPATGQISRYDQFVAIHMGVTVRGRAAGGGATEPLGDGGHGGPAFCAWHREFILRFEQALQSVDPNVTLPYWDWTEHQATEERLFVDAFLGPTGGAGNVVPSGPFAQSSGWLVYEDLHIPGVTMVPPTPTESNGPALLRQLRPFEQLPTVGNVSYALRQPTFAEFRPALEAGPRLHNFGHGWVGGSMMMMSSPQDPIFFLHHCNIDRLWALWEDDGRETDYPWTTRVYGHALDDPMWPWDGRESFTVDWVNNLVPEYPIGDVRRPRDTLDYRGLGYSYA